MYVSVGLRELGLGNRAASRRALRQCLDMGACTYVEFRFAQVLMARTEADPAWPEW